MIVEKSTIPVRKYVQEHLFSSRGLPMTHSELYAYPEKRLPASYLPVPIISNFVSPGEVVLAGSKPSHPCRTDCGTSLLNAVSNP